MRRAAVVGSIVIVALVAACSRSGRGLRFPQAPVIVISIDTLRADRLPAYGYRGVETPNLDRFRRDAILFENAYSHCPMTLPSHVSMLTGLLPTEHHVRNNIGYVFQGDAGATLPQLLKRRGYATGAAVSSYVLRGETGLAPLFDEYEDSIDPRPGAAFAEYQRSGFATAAFAKEWIDRHRDRPFFYFFHIYEPHVPYDPPEPFRSRYRDPYDGEVATSDAIVGDLLDHLRRIGVYDRAVLIVTSDHGEGLGDHGEEQHSILLYVEAIRVPMLLKLPGARLGGSKVGTPAQLIDLMPTIAELLDVAPPPDLRGTSLLRLRGDHPLRRIYAETLYPRIQLGWSELRSIVEGRWHYIESPRPELYDLSHDPGERRDLVTAEPGVVASLESAFAGFPVTGTRGAAARTTDGAGSSGPGGTSGSVDPTVARGLEALGYVGTPRQRGEGPLPNPKDSLPYLGEMKKGFRLAAERRPEEAAAVLRSVVKASPGLIEAWIKLGEVLFEAGRYEESAAAFREALSGSPVLLADVAIESGQAQLRIGKLAEAEGEARRALASSPTRAHELLARVALARNELGAAEEHARAAAGARTPQPSSMLVLAEVLVARNDLTGALEVLDQAAARATELRLGYIYRLDFLRGDALARAGRPNEAEAAYRREIHSFPGDVRAYANLAVLYVLERRGGDADGLMEEMVRANPGHQALVVAARTFQGLGDRLRAARWERRARGPAGG